MYEPVLIPVVIPAELAVTNDARQFWHGYYSVVSRLL